MVLPKQVTEMSNCVEDLENQHRCQKKSGTVVSILQLLISLTLSNFEYCTNCTKLFFNLFSRQILERIWDNSLCGILSSTVTVTPIYLEQWAPALGNLEMQPLRWNTRCNVNSSDPQEMHSFRRLSASNRIRFRSYWRQKSPARLQSPESAIKKHCQRHYGPRRWLL